MRVIQRAATCAYAFVAMNWDQAAALVYLARGGEAGSQERTSRLERVSPQGTERGTHERYVDSARRRRGTGTGWGTDA